LLLWKIFSSDAQRMPYRKDGNCMGDEGKAVGSAQAPAALLSPNHTRTALSPDALAAMRGKRSGFRYVRFESKADFPLRRCDVRFGSDSGH
jgi:hypothetical protein